MRGDALASGASSATFTATDKKDLGKKFEEAVAGVTPTRKPIFGQCNVKGCEEFVAYSAEEFVEHVHDVHA